MKTKFQLSHMNAQKEDLEGNQGIGRYIFLPGSNARAKAIAERFTNLMVKEHNRGHHLYLGLLPTKNGPIEVAAIPSGMGCPSMEIILHELYQLGAKRFLRVGTAGSLQPQKVKLGDIIHALGAVRDESTTQDYVPISFPAVSSFEFNTAIREAARHLNYYHKFHSGIIHCKSSLYAKEFRQGPQAKINDDYLNLLNRAGVLASEMETSTLLIQSLLYNHELSLKGEGPAFRVYAGSILTAVTLSVGDEEMEISPDQAENDLIDLGIEAVKCLADMERFN